MSRTTRALLDRLIERVNTTLGNPQLPWSIGDYNEETDTTPVSPNVGNWHITKINGKYRVERMEEHGTSDPLGSEHLTAHELEIQLRAYLAGLEKKS
jgi:hypothetical protein